MLIHYFYVSFINIFIALCHLTTKILCNYKINIFIEGLKKKKKKKKNQFFQKGIAFYMYVEYKC